MKIALVGYGAMGKVVEQNISDSDRIVGIVDLNNLPSLFALTEKPDVIVDFSNPACLDDICNYASQNKVPVVIATTGYSSEQLEKIKTLSQSVPVLFSGNYSLGVILLNRLVKEITPILKDTFDIEIIEKHHNKKVDAPSGTALALADSLNEAAGGVYEYKYDRSSERVARDKKEIGISAVRGGTIVGEHEVLFAGEDEVIEFCHTAYSKAVFGKGALEAAKFLAGKEAGKYDMSDVIQF